MLQGVGRLLTQQINTGLTSEKSCQKDHSDCLTEIITMFAFSEITEFLTGMKKKKKPKKKQCAWKTRVWIKSTLETQKDSSETQSPGSPLNCHGI